MHTDLGSVVICDKKDLVYEEAPGAYKDIDAIVQCLAEIGSNHGGLVKIIASLKPILTYKYKESGYKLGHFGLKKQEQTEEKKEESASDQD